MKTRYIIVAIIACIGVSLYLRIALPYDRIFTGEWIKFSGVDSYWQMAQVDKIAPDFPAYFTRIFQMPFFIWLLSGVTWCIGLGSPTPNTIDTVGVYFPPILAALTVVPVYVIGKEMFGKMAGIVAAVLIAVLPGEWLGRSTLGFTDHHVAEVLLSTTAIMFFIIAFKSDGKRRIAFTMLSALFMAMYLSTFRGGVIFVFIIGAFLCSQVIIDALRHRGITYPEILLAVGVAVAMTIYMVKPDVYIQITTAVVILQGSVKIGLTTMELQPLLFPMGTFTLAIVWAFFGFVALLVPLALVLLIYRVIRTEHFGTILLIIWSIATLVMMLEYQRFAYYFAVNVSLLTGWFAWYVWQYLKKKSVVFAVLIVAILLVAMVIPNAQRAVATAKQYPYTPPDAWCETLEWVEENTPEDSVILSWWDYGYWINRMAHRGAYADPSQSKGLVTNTAQMFISGKGVEADYIILDYATVTGKFWAVATWAERQPTRFSDTFYITRDRETIPVLLFYPAYYESLAVRLYNFDGKAVTPARSTVITFNASNRMIHNVDTYTTYLEAVSHIGLGQRLVGASPFISPIPLEAESEYTLIYESEQEINRVPEVKVFKRERR